MHGKKVNAFAGLCCVTCIYVRSTAYIMPACIHNGCSFVSIFSSHRHRQQQLNKIEYMHAMWPIYNRHTITFIFTIEFYLCNNNHINDDDDDNKTTQFTLYIFRCAILNAIAFYSLSFSFISVLPECGIRTLRKKKQQS